MLLNCAENLDHELLRLKLTAAKLPLEMPLEMESHLYQRMPCSISGRSKRQLDFEVGRFCAGQGLSRLGQETEVGVGPDRCPRWPTSTIGSISHSERFAWAVVGRKTEFISIGIDTEPIADEPTLQHLYGEITLPREIELFEALGFTRNEAFTIIFSIKESLYKCVYQVEPVFFGFHDAEIVHIDFKSAKIQLTQRNPNRTFAGQELHVDYVIHGKDIFAACWLRQIGKAV